MGKGKGAIRRRRAWRNRAFKILKSRSLNDIPKGDRSNALREVLKSKITNE